MNKLHDADILKSEVEQLKKSLIDKETELEHQKMEFYDETKSLRDSLDMTSKAFALDYSNLDKKLKDVQDKENFLKIKETELFNRDNFHINYKQQLDTKSEQLEELDDELDIFEMEITKREEDVSKLEKELIKATNDFKSRKAQYDELYDKYSIAFKRIEQEGASFIEKRRELKKIELNAQERIEYANKKDREIEEKVIKLTELEDKIDKKIKQGEANENF